MNKNYETTIFIKFGGMGDLLMATPAIRAFKRSNSETKVCLITADTYAEIFENNKYIDKIYFFREAYIFSSPMRQVLEMMRLILCLRRIKPKRVFIFHRDWRWNLIGLLSGAKLRYGFRRDVNGLFLTAAIENDPALHESEKYLRIVDLDGHVNRDGTSMDLPPSSSDVARVRKVSNELEMNVQKKVWIAIAPGGAKNANEESELRRWPIESYLSLVKLILGREDWKVILVGGKDDRVYTNGLCASGLPISDFAGKLSPAQTCELLRHCDAMVANDSGPMHLGAAAGIPVIGIFGPTNPIEKYPVTHELSTYVWKGVSLKCSPCYRDGRYPELCPYSHKCMTEISAKEVYEKLSSIVERASIYSA